MFADPGADEQAMLAAQQRAAEFARRSEEAKRARDAAAQAEYDKMMSSYKQLAGSQDSGFKNISNLDLGFKSLDGDPESLAANARKPFDTAGDTAVNPSSGNLGGTPFFGDTMPVEDIRLLVNPENDPDVVDLRDAEKYVVENIKETPAVRPPQKSPSVSPSRAAECARTAEKLQGFIHQREQFQKTVARASGELAVWQAANRNALLSAAKEGLEWYTGKLVDRFMKRAEAAERLQRIYEKNAASMARDGLNVAEIEAKIKRLRAFSSAGKVVELTGNISDWQNFIKDGVSGIMAQLSSSNQDIGQMLEDPQMQKYFETETPELKALLDISEIAASNKVFGKWVAKKVPIIAAVQFSINQTYNALDWFLSYKQIAESNKINGQVLNAARSLQQKIDHTSMELGNCR
jgi:hypothetical protein